MRFRKPGKGLGPYVVASLVLHAALSVIYVRAVSGARVPSPRVPVYRVSLVELPAPEPEPEPVKPERVEPEVKPVKPEKVPEKPRPRKEKPKEEPKEEPKPEPKAEEKPEETKTVSSGPVTVEAEDFLFAYYLALIENRVGSRWNPPRGLVSGGRRPVATVRFEILRSGRVAGARIAESSGIDFFDRAALRAVNESDPFPELPEGFTGDRLSVNFVFRLED